MTDINQFHTPDTLSPGTTAVHPASHIPIVYFGISVRRLVCLFILTLGLYRFYWFYKNWKAIKEAEQSDISPFWRSFFGIFFCHKLFKYIAESAQNYANKRPFSPKKLAVWYILLQLVVSIIGLGFLIIIILVKAQRAILFNNAQVIPNYQPVKQYTRVEIIWIIIGILLWSIGIKRVVADDKSKHHATTWITFQPESKDFKVKFPTAPTQEAEQLPVDDTDLSIDYTSYSVDQDGVYYSVTRMVYPSEIDISTLEAEDLIQDIVETSADNKLIESKKTKVGEHSAADFLIKSSYAHLKGRIVLIGQTKYLLMISYLKNYSASDYKQFINSFSIETSQR